MADVHHTAADCRINISGFDDDDDDDDDDDAQANGISQPEVTCLCCYDVLLDPTTLSCGHSFCRHCLALWVCSSRKAACPTCRSIWHGFPKVNISFRDLVEKHFQADVARRRQSVMADPRAVRSLQVLQQAKRVIGCRVAAPPPVRWFPWLGPGGFFSGILITLTFTAVVFLVYHWSAKDLKVERLVKKPLELWTPEEVAVWMENLGAWTSPYGDIFLREQVNGRLLNALGEQDLLKPPYGIENDVHRRALLKEVYCVQELGFKRPQNVWEYKAVNGGKSLFLLYTMTDSPRLSILYMYFFDYYDSFLPFIHVSCPSAKEKSSGDDLLFRNLDSPDWRQWLSFAVQFCLLPYQLSYDFVWNWQDVHCWTSRLVMWHCFILTLQEGHILWRLRSHIHLRTILNIFFCHVCMIGAVCFTGLLFWNILHQFFWDCLFYWALYFLPFSSAIIVLFPIIRQLCPYFYNQQ